MPTTEQSPRPVPSEPDGQPERSYVMLEEQSAEQLLRDVLDHLSPPVAPDQGPLIKDLLDALGDRPVYVPIGKITAKNTTSAYRTVVRDRFGDSEGSMVVAAVPARHFKPARRGQSPSGMKFNG